MVSIKCRYCQFADFYIDQYSGGPGFDCLRQKELGDLVEDILDGKQECPFFKQKIQR